MTAPLPPTTPEESRLESWKEIAAYLSRDARTVRRWEQAEGLPVHRHRHLARSSVYAYASELDAWRARRKPESRVTDRATSRPVTHLAAVAALVLATVTAGGGRSLGPMAASQAPGQISRQVWAAPPESPDAMSRDGRWLSYRDLATLEVVVRELATGREYRVSGRLNADEPTGVPYGSALSPDGAKVLIQWQIANPPQASSRAADGRVLDVPERSSLRIADVRSGGAQRSLYDNPELGWIVPMDWSPDGRTVAVHIAGQDGSGQIGLLSTADGRLRILTTTTWSGTSNMFFSPDGRRLAFNLPVSTGSSNHDIFVIDVDGGAQVAAVTHAARDTVVGWTNDGEAVLFASDRSGRTALYAMPITNGTPAGSPVLIKPDLGRLNASFGVDRNGRLLYAVQTAASTIQTAEVDFKTGRLLAGPTTPVETYLWASDEPDWSRDGRSLVFRLEQPESKMVLAIRDLSSGATRHVAPDVGRFSGPTWLPDGSVAVKASDLKGRMAIRRVDPASGATRELVLLDALAGRTFFPSPDGGTVFYLLRQTDRRGVWAKNLDTGEERRVRPFSSSAPNSPFAISPDGRSVAFLEPGTAPGTAVLKVAPIAGGDARDVTRFEAGHRLLFMLRWTREGRLVYGRWIGERTSATAFSIPVNGGVPVELDARIPGGPSLAIHPDGRRVAYESGGTALEVWSLEGFQVR